MITILVECELVECELVVVAVGEDRISCVILGVCCSYFCDACVVPSLIGFSWYDFESDSKGIVVDVFSFVAGVDV